jgi:acyl-CoA synthetase (AMP-forming)/AMP-acid ligase II
MPMFHTASCGLVTLSSVQFGLRMILVRLFDATRVLDIMEAEGVNVLCGMPTMYVALTESQATAPRDVSAVRIGTLSVGCNCFTPMTVSGSPQAGGYAGGWGFSASGEDANDDFVRDDANGSFVFHRVP